MVSIYKKDSHIAKLVEHITTEEGKVEFLKTRIYIFLRGWKGDAFSSKQIATHIGLTDQLDLVQRAVAKLIYEKKHGIHLTQDNTRIYYNTEAPSVTHS